jgi:hypothetical protein
MATPVHLSCLFRTTFRKHIFRKIFKKRIFRTIFRKHSVEPNLPKVSMLDGRFHIKTRQSGIGCPPSFTPFALVAADDQNRKSFGKHYFKRVSFRGHFLEQIIATEQSAIISSRCPVADAHRPSIHSALLAAGNCRGKRTVKHDDHCVRGL